MYIYDSKYNNRLLLSHEEEAFSSDKNETEKADTKSGGTTSTSQPTSPEVPAKPECGNLKGLVALTKENIALSVEQLQLMQKNIAIYCADNKNEIHSALEKSITSLGSLADPASLKERCQLVGEAKLKDELENQINELMQTAIDQMETLRAESCCKVSSVQNPKEFQQMISDYWQSFRRSWITFMQVSNQQLDRNTRNQLKDRLKKVQKNIKIKADNLDQILPPGKCAKSVAELKAQFNLGLARLFEQHQTLMLENFFSLRGERRNIRTLIQSGSFNQTRLKTFIDKGQWSQAVVNMSQIPAVSISVGLTALDELERERQLNAVVEDRVKVVKRVVRQGVTLPPKFRVKVNQFLLDAVGRQLGDNPTDEEIEAALNNSIPEALGKAREEYIQFLKAVFKRRLKKMLGGNRSQESRKPFGFNPSLVRAIRQLSVQEIVRARAGQPF